jgi:hypothetical protein
MLILDYSKTYKNTDLQAAVRAAREALARVDFPRRISALATSTDRAAALEAWQRVAELAAWLELHAEDDEARKAAREAGQLARRERERLAALPMADDAKISDAARREVIASTDGHTWKTLPPTVRAAIRGRYVPASPDDADMPDRLDADVLALSPSRIVCAPRPSNEKFKLNTK